VVPQGFETPLKLVGGDFRTNPTMDFRNRTTGKKGQVGADEFLQPVILNRL
jgi:hypothetical protein